MIEDNYKAAARLIATTEAQTKLPVRIDWDDQLTFLLYGQTNHRHLQP